jgi:hypothetical protein
MALNMELEQSREKRCALCGAVLEEVADDASGEFRCHRCGTTGRYNGVDLVAILIPGYHRRLMELESLNRELVAEIDKEGTKGPGRDMRYLQRKHLERQDVLAEYSFLSHFSGFVEKW